MDVFNQNSSTGTSNENTGFFDVTTQGYGYINDIRSVDPESYGGKGDPYLACRIAALNGPANNVEYLRFDVIVVGSKATDIIMGPIKQHLEQLVSEDLDPKDAKIEIAFRLGDVKPQLFVYNKDSKYNKKGDSGVSMKGRLLRITHLKLDGNVYDLTPFLDSDPSQEDEAPEEKC